MLLSFLLEVKRASPSPGEGARGERKRNEWFRRTSEREAKVVPLNVFGTEQNNTRCHVFRKIIAAGS